MTIRSHLSLSLSLSLSVSVAAAATAFPGAEGPAMFATGGRGGEVVRVTNLNATGPGSLADAVRAPNRIVVFDVSGIIDLTQGKGDKAKGGTLSLDQPNLTLAGQTAPGEGICLKGGKLTVEASNIVIRHLRVRRGFIAEGDANDAIEINVKDPAYVTGQPLAPTDWADGARSSHSGRHGGSGPAALRRRRGCRG